MGHTNDHIIEVKEKVDVEVEVWRSLGAVGFDLFRRPDQSASTVPSANPMLWKPFALNWWCNSMSAYPWFLLL